MPHRIAAFQKKDLLGTFTYAWHLACFLGALCYILDLISSKSLITLSGEMTYVTWKYTLCAGGLMGMIAHHIPEHRMGVLTRKYMFAILSLFITGLMALAYVGALSAAGQMGITPSTPLWTIVLTGSLSVAAIIHGIRIWVETNRLLEQMSLMERAIDSPNGG